MIFTAGEGGGGGGGGGLKYFGLLFQNKSTMQSPSLVYQLLVCHNKVVQYSCMSTSVLANTNDGELIGSKL